MMTSIISWNVNGIRAAERKGFYEFLQRERPTICCVQETKAAPSQLAEHFLHQEGYTSFWSSAEKKGYSGVAVYTQTEPLQVRELSEQAFQSEGRGLIVEYPHFTLINAYFPNSQEGGNRLDYKLAFCAHILELCNELDRAGKALLLCGDYNIAHKAIDLARPKENERSPGYLPEERAWMDSFIAAGYVDSFRHFCTEPHQYTWWSYRSNARARNVGWRIDYHCVNKALLSSVKKSQILSEVQGSDHCPLKIVLDSSSATAHQQRSA